MKTIGLLGGMSWESTVTYYQLLNRFAAEKLGGLHSAKILLHSVDFAGLEALLSAGDWESIAHLLADAARGLETAGADMIALCTNTMHKVAPEIEKSVHIPFLHITDAVSSALKEKGIITAALLGTRFTMQQDFYKTILWHDGFEILLPDDWQMQETDRIIFEELCKGKVTEDSRAFFLALIDSLAQQGAQGVILGCTEIGLAVTQADTPIPLFDTTQIHARAIAKTAFGE